MKYTDTSTYHKMDCFFQQVNDLPFLVLKSVCRNLAMDKNDLGNLLILAFSSRQVFWAALPFIWESPCVSKGMISNFATTMVDPIYTRYIRLLEVQSDDDEEWMTFLPSLPLVEHLQGLKIDFVCITLFFGRLTKIIFSF